MSADQPKVRQNYIAILVAAIACFVFEATWYSIFLKAWMDGIGRTMEWLSKCGMNPGVQYATALVSGVVLASAISCLTQLTGPQTAWRGMKVAALLWLGFVVPTWTTEYIFEVRPISLWAVNCGFWLLGMILQGAIVGGWKKKY
jgi:hypothetical protein